MEEIGPGAYDGDYKILKKNFVRDVHFWFLLYII